MAKHDKYLKCWFIQQHKVLISFLFESSCITLVKNNMVLVTHTDTRGATQLL